MHHPKGQVITMAAPRKTAVKKAPAKRAASKSASKDKEFVQQMDFDRSTKGTHLLRDDADAALVSSLYVRKVAAGDQAPKSATVTVVLHY
jgi:hypothetical protein